MSKSILDATVEIVKGAFYGVNVTTIDPVHDKDAVLEYIDAVYNKLVELEEKENKKYQSGLTYGNEQF